MKKVLLILVLLGIAGFFYWQWSSSPVNSSDTSSKTFVIDRGEAARAIGDSLQSQKFIRSSIVFDILLRMQGGGNSIEAGDYKLSPSMGIQEIINTLHHGTLDVWVTIPEGLRAEEIAAILQKNISDYNSSWNTQLNQNEGYLFPDTYLFPKVAPIASIISIMKNNFNTKYQAALQSATQSFPQSEVVNLASIVQREAITQSDMQGVASVLENRLRLGMPLGSDVTLEYALGYQADEKTWWKKDLTADDLTLQSSYNTRLNTGLPPTPISNPGLTAIEAVLSPAKTNYLYYLSDSNGKLHFATTLAQHNANIKKYLNNK